MKLWPDTWKYTPNCSSLIVDEVEGVLEAKGIDIKAHRDV